MRHQNHHAPPSLSDTKQILTRSSNNMGTVQLEDTVKRYLVLREEADNREEESAKRFLIENKRKRIKIRRQHHHQRQLQLNTNSDTTNSKLFQKVIIQSTNQELELNKAHLIQPKLEVNETTVDTTETVIETETTTTTTTPAMTTSIKLTRIQTTPTDVLDEQTIDQDEEAASTTATHNIHRRPSISLDRHDRLTQAQLDRLGSLIKIIRSGNYNEFLELLERRGFKNLLNVFVDGQTALHYSLIYGRSLAWCKQLVLNGANPNLTNRAGWHPIHLAAFNGSRETMRYLIDCIAN